MEYKDTPIGRIPVEWDVKQVQDIFDVETGTTPSTRKSEYWENGNVVWITPADMNKIQGITIKDSERKVTDIALRESNLNLVPKKSIIMSTRAPVGYVALTSKETAFNQGCKGLVPKDNNVTDTTFYSYYILSQKNRLQHLSGGSTFRELAKDTLKRIDLPIPPLPEQEKIAEILSTTDLAIQKSDEIIAKTERLKKGMMQKLLTEGIGHEEFKDTPIGRIPEDWDIVKISKVLKLTSGKSRPKEISEITSEKTPYPVYGGNGILGYTNELLFDQKTIVIGRVGEYCGSIYITPDSSWITDNALYVKQLKITVNLNFLAYFLKFLNLNQFKKKMGQPLLTQAIVYSKEIPLPPLPEQEKIAEILSKIDELKLKEVKRKENLQNIKKGLMNDLLTGRRRVLINN